MAYTIGKAVIRTPARIASAQAVESMSAEARFLAHLANVAYSAPAQRPLHQNDFALDLEFNTERFAVYTCGGWLSAKVVVVAYRGTSDMSDVRNDLLLASNTNVNRLKQLLSSEVDCIDAVARKYPEARIHVTGHSLGGTIAMFVTVHTGLVSGGHIFNPGAGVKTEELLLGTVAFVLGAPVGVILGCSAAAGALACAHEKSHEGYGVGKVAELASRINSHHVLGDPLSMLFSLGIVHCYSPTKANLHALANFVDDDLPSTHGVCSAMLLFGQSPCCIDKPVRVSFASVRGRSVSPKPERRPSFGGTCARRTHSYSGAGGWTEVVGRVGDKAKRSMVKRLIAPSIDSEAAAPQALPAESEGTEVAGHLCRLLDGFVFPSKEEWRSSLEVGSLVQVMALASESEGRERKWVEAEVAIARPRVLTLKWMASNGGGETFRRVARDSTEIRRSGCLDHGDANLGTDGKVGVDAPKVSVGEEPAVAAVVDESWRSSLIVGSVAELWVKQQWTRAEVSIAREKVLTMKWIDSGDGGETMRRISRDTSALRPCKA